MAYKSSQLDNLLALRLLKILVTPFEEFPAYKSGIIDENGKYITPKNKRTSDQRKTLTYLDRLMINVKKIINKLPGGENKLKNLVAAMFLIKECQQNKDDGEMLTEQYVEQYIERCDELHTDYRHIVAMWETYVKLKETCGTSCISGHSPTNTTNAIAGYDLPLFGQVIKRKQIDE